jgi:predicted nucleotidyltransferase
VAKKSRPDATKSGRFLLRLPASLHDSLRRAAGDAGISLNEHCVRTLGAPSSGSTDVTDATRAVARTVAIFGRDLVAVAAFGSWARGELVDHSDVDLLVVLDTRVDLTRDLYRRWDAEPPLRWSERLVDAHFVHLPDREAPVTGLWGEVAVDGVVLFERGLALSALLVRIRRDLAAGRIARRMAHGQPYWTMA